MYDLLFSPGKIGGLTLPNRIAMTAASASLSQPDGTMTEDMLAYYEARAKGGVGLIITEMVCVDEDRGVLFPRELNAAREENIPSFRRLADRVHPHGTKIFAQLFHPGANADPKLNPLDLISASPARGKKRGQARAATAEEIHAIAAKFGQAARRVQEAGFDGVEVHAGHHYFLHSFLSPVTNHRTDGYGGSLENRTRILREIVEAIRAACGRDFPLMFRISLEEYIGKDGYHADTGIKICQMLEGWGVDAINVTASGTDSKLSQSVEPMYYPQGWRKHLAKAVKGTVSIPVLSVALIRDPAYAEKLLREGVLDFAGSVRTHLADPNWAAKARAGQEEDILPCISCMASFAKYDHAHSVTQEFYLNLNYDLTQSWFAGVTTSYAFQGMTGWWFQPYVGYKAALCPVTDIVVTAGMSATSSYFGAAFEQANGAQAWWVKAELPVKLGVKNLSLVPFVSFNWAGCGALKVNKGLDKGDKPYKNFGVVAGASLVYSF